MSAQAAEKASVVEVRDLYKRFGGVHALDGASLAIEQGEAVALVGDNGAGKTTLVKAIAGVQPPDSGEIFIEGNLVQIRSPKDAGRLGIEVAYQDLALANSIDVPGNVFLGEEPRKWNLGFFSLLDFGRMMKETQETLDKLRIKIPNMKVDVGSLSGGQRQAVAIGRIIRKKDPTLLILDEPTAALGVEEVRKVLDLIQALKDKGQTMLIISHDLEHVFMVSDRIFIMRSGRVIAVRSTAETTKTEIVQLIVGDLSGVEAKNNG